MSRTLVIYKSKYGSTKKYADMLKEELACDIVESRDFDKSMLKNYDCIILAGGIYAGGVAGIKILQKNYGEIENKKVAVFCVGASPFDEKAILQVREYNLKGNLNSVPLFYGRGAWDESRMSFKDRTLCKMLQKMTAKQTPDSCEPWMKELLFAAGKKCDWTDRKYLAPLLEYVGR